LSSLDRRGDDEGVRVVELFALVSLLLVATDVATTPRALLTAERRGAINEPPWQRGRNQVKKLIAALVIAGVGVAGFASHAGASEPTQEPPPKRPFTALTEEDWRAKCLTHSR
jgi:hypothetical protein